MTSTIGAPVSRIDGPAKVTGGARYAAETRLPGLAHAALVTSAIPAGRIAAIDDSRARAAGGVVAVIHCGDAPRLPYKPLAKRPVVDPGRGEPLKVFQDAEIRFAGQPVAVVVAETPEQALHAARLVEVAYDRAEAAADFDATPATEVTAEARGDVEAALAAAPVVVEGRHRHAREYHNAIEPHATVAAWEGARLTLYDKTQWVSNIRRAIAHVFDMPEADIRVVSPYVGGAFGSALRAWPHVAVAALAARVVGRPVSLELTRRDLYTTIGYRPQTEQRIALGAERDGRLVAIRHETWAETSLYEGYAEGTLNVSRKAYACPNVAVRGHLRPMNVNSPGPMRAPGTVTGLAALEIAMDELAVALELDPVALRMRNIPERDQIRDLPWSSIELAACYETAAARFGWERRDPRPGSMRDGGVLVGWGMATAIYGANQSPASVSATLFANGSALIRSATSDMGPGTYTALAQVAADALGVAVEAVRVEIGDSDLPRAPVHGGSITMASVGAGVAAACEALREKLAGLGGEAGVDDGISALRLHGLDAMEATADARPDVAAGRYSASAFGAIFVEVRVDPDFGTVRVPRMVGAYDVGRVINPKLARSQCVGGMVGGLGMALLEQAEWDPSLGRVMNANLAEYLVPVCADVEELDVTFVPADDRRFNPLGAKGLAEIAICGVAPAIANAVFHATGKRIRDLPITPERVLRG
jgi:xanthine dehydrogenase YagR molybdenum-binding subunit